MLWNSLRSDEKNEIEFEICRSKFSGDSARILWCDWWNDRLSDRSTRSGNHRESGSYNKTVYILCGT